MMNDLYFDDDEDDNENNIPEDLNSENLSKEELKRRYDILQTLVYNKDRLIMSQISNIERLEEQYKNIQNQYAILYGAFTNLSERVKQMAKREKVIRLFLKQKEFDLHDVDEFINELKIDNYYKKKKEKK